METAWTSHDEKMNGFNRFCPKLVKRANKSQMHTKNIIDRINSRLPPSDKIDYGTRGHDETSMNICLNTTTEKPHCENDMSLTAIWVPHSNKGDKKYWFNFKLNDEASIRIAMKPGTMFMFNAYFLTHNQSRDGSRHFATWLHIQIGLWTNMRCKL